MNELIGTDLTVHAGNSTEGDVDKLVRKKDTAAETQLGTALKMIL